jgi:hypothetical protein
MYIRKTKLGENADGSTRSGYRIVDGVYNADRSVTQRTLIHIGQVFHLDEKYWKPLCQRIKEIILNR